MTLEKEVREEEENVTKDESDLHQMMETFKRTTMVGLDLIEYYEKLKSKVDDLKTVNVSQHSIKE